MTYWFCPKMARWASQAELLKMEDDNYNECIEAGMSENDADQYSIEYLSEDTGIDIIKLSEILWS